MLDIVFIRSIPLKHQTQSRKFIEVHYHIIIIIMLSLKIWVDHAKKLPERYKLILVINTLPCRNLKGVYIKVVSAQVLSMAVTRKSIYIHDNWLACC